MCLYGFNMDWLLLLLMLHGVWLNVNCWGCIACRAFGRALFLSAVVGWDVNSPEYEAEATTKKTKHNVYVWYSISQRFHLNPYLFLKKHASYKIFILYSLFEYIAAVDKIDRVGSLKKILRDSLTRRSRRSSSKVMSVEIEDIRDADDLKAVDEFRQALILDELLPEKHDDYHMLLRSFHFFSCSLETG